MLTATGREVPILRITSDARPYIWTPTALEDVSDPSLLVVEFAIPEAGSPPVDWQAGDWFKQPSGWETRILVGPGGTLAPGDGNFDLHCRIHADPQLFEDIVARVVIG